jgi:predicted RNA binding protein YcfA (HicA-like mRNA interferase family)
MGKSKYPPLTPGEVEAIVRALGFMLKAQEGSHRHYERCKEDSRPRSLVTIDMSEKDFGDYLIKSMIRQSNFTRE